MFVVTQQLLHAGQPQAHLGQDGFVLGDGFVLAGQQAMTVDGAAGGGAAKLVEVGTL
ncbi:hypothetical protein [Nonomuraea turcica]|uniref:hypothetical protein n=1 Tax=Nonomuraea sp. G32 TaxID=3067274 RepID=UPI00273BBE5E|nr:hypothetical protein [Nonomuraea sp. G32]MDP4510314.1 hypothetical protein [Nonomuraea sp. G32]